jgi:Histone acetylation protein/Bromodomain
VYYIAPDGGCLYCQRCHTGLPSVLPQLERSDGDTCRYKRGLLKRKNDEEIVESWIACTSCNNSVHQMCAMHNPYVHNDEKYKCPNCSMSERNSPPPLKREPILEEVSDEAYSFVAGTKIPVKLSDIDGESLRSGSGSLYSDSLPHTPISKFIELKVRERMMTEEYPNAEKTISVRMISDCERFFMVPEAVRKHFNMNSVSRRDGHIPPPRRVFYRSKAVMLFQKVDGLDVCIFCMYVHEYDGHVPNDDAESTTKELASQRKRVYIAYLDSVEHFRPRVCRTGVYQEILTAYLATARKRGYESAHIWACPPSRGNSFVFWNHPSAQKTPNMERLTAWYYGALSRSAECGVVTDIKSLYESDFEKSMDLVESDVFNNGVNIWKMACPPLLDGDFWIEEAKRIYSVHASRQFNSITSLPDDQTSTDHGDSQDPCPAIQVAAMLRDKVIAHPSSAAFRRPVNAAALKLKDYHTVISRPIDLGTIHSRLTLGEYRDLNELCVDVELVISNAKKYNPPGHYVHLKAIEIYGLFLDELKQLTKCWAIAHSERCDGGWSNLGEISLSLGARLKPCERGIVIDSSADSSINGIPMTVSGESESSFSDDKSCTSAKSSPTVGSSASSQSSIFRPNTIFDGPDAIQQLMIGPDSWLLDKKNPVPPKCNVLAQKCKRKKSSTDSLDEPAAKRRRPTWLGEEVGCAVRRMRTSFFACSLLPQTSPSAAIEKSLQAFEAYAKDFNTSQKKVPEVPASRVADSRHGLLEFSQFRGLEFDTLRRAKYSSAVLLYHLHHDGAPGLLPTCTACDSKIKCVRWHRIGRVVDLGPACTQGKPKKMQAAQFIPEELCTSCYANHKSRDHFIPQQVSI